MILQKGKIYAQSLLILRGWTAGDGSDHVGYAEEYYFDAYGRYLGPDIHGIEPIFEDQP